MPAYPASHHQTEPHTPTDAPELNRTVWDRASARLLAKMLGEFAYEEVIEPLPRTGDGAGPSGDYAVRLDDGATLVFRARRGVYGGWRVDPATIREVTGEGLGDRAEDGAPFRDPLRFLARGRGLLGLDGATLAHLIRELTATLAADAR
ncbi:IucA/IucC family siderophore biosynthesis protein, partial [Streptomyces sp. wa22]